MSKNQEQLETMCENLTALRIEHDLTIEQLSKATKVPKTVLTSIENKVLLKSFSTTHLLRLCKFYNIKPRCVFLNNADR